MNHLRPHNRRTRGFTLIELLVVIGIILVLLAILLPVVSHVRMRAYNTNTQQQMSRIMAACQMYYHDFNSYPGPIANAFLAGASGTDNSATKLAPPSPGSNASSFTSSENLVLGLFGLLSPAKTAGSPPTFTQTPFTPPNPPLNAPTHDVLSLNVLHPQSYHYMDYIPDELSPGPVSSLEYATGQKMLDTLVPEFVDRFPDKMPIIYTRAYRGNPDGAASGKSTPVTVQYNWDEIGMYGSNLRKADHTAQWQLFTQTAQTAMYGQFNSNNLDDDEATPYNDFWSNNPSANASYYFSNPNVAGSTRGKDGFILIAAGLDRTYGTQDDIIITP